MLPGISGMAGFTEDSTFDVSYIGYSEDTVTRSTYTFAAESFGAEASSRKIFVLAHWSSAADARSLSSATIGGVAATIHVQTNKTDGVGQSLGVGIISASVPTGETGTVVLTMSGNSALGAIGVIRVVNLAAIVDTASTTTESTSPLNPSTVIDVAANGALLAAVTSASDDGGIAWTGATERYEDTDAGGSDAEKTRYSGALSTGLSVEVNRTVSMTQNISGTNAAGLVAVSIR